MKIAVVHEDINAGGGAEAVLANNTLQAVQTRHEVTLFTVTECNLESLNDYHGTSVEPERVTVLNPLPSSVDTTLRLLERLVVRTLPITKLKDIKSSIMKRHLETRDTEYDVFVCARKASFPLQHHRLITSTSLFCRLSLPRNILKKGRFSLSAGDYSG